MELVDGEAFAPLGLPNVMSRLASVGGGGGPVRRSPRLALLHGPVDGHGAAGEVLQLLDAGLAPEVGGGGEGSARVTVAVSDPGVTQHLLGRQSLGALFGQQLTYESPGQQGDVPPVVLREYDFTLANVLEQHLLTVLAVLSSLPPAVEATVAGKWGISTEENVHDYSEGPHITGLVVADQVVVFVVAVQDIVTHHEGVDHLGRHVFETAHGCEEVRSGDGDV